jgi:hypothetical protein
MASNSDLFAWRGQSISTETVMQFTEEHVNKRFQAHMFLYCVNVLCLVKRYKSSFHRELICLVTNIINNKILNKNTLDTYNLMKYIANRKYTKEENKVR